MHRFLPAILLLAAVSALIPATARADDCAKAPEGPQRQLCQAYGRLEQTTRSRTRLTRFKHEHNRNADDDGKVFADTQKLFEDTWINDLPYERLVEVNGKPLEGKALEVEQGRFDKAVAERRALDMAARARQTGGHFFNTDLDGSALATGAFRVVRTAEERCGEAACMHTTLEPVGKTSEGHKVQQRRFEVWVTDGQPLLTRLRYELLGDEDAVRKGSTGTIDWILFDGMPVEGRTEFVGRIRLAMFRTVRVHTENVFDRYRRFSTSVTISPATEVPPGP